MRVTPDYLDGRASALVTRQGTEATRLFLVSDIPGAASDKLARATSAPEIPGIGSPHPYLKGARLESLQAVPISDDPAKAVVIAEYRTPNADNLSSPFAPRVAADAAILEVQLFTQVFDEQTTLDRNGERMIVGFHGASLSQVGISQFADLVTATVKRPRLGVRIRHERPRLPRELAGQILGAVNAREWSGYAPLTWLCTNFSSRSDSGVVVVEFEALYNPDTWRVRHELQIAGRVPEQATIGNGIGVFDVYPEFDFNRAGLSF